MWADQPHDGRRDGAVQRARRGDARLRCAGGTVRWHSPQRRVAPGQSVVFFDPTDRYVLGGGIARLTVSGVPAAAAPRRARLGATMNDRTCNAVPRGAALVGASSAVTIDAR